MPKLSDLVGKVVRVSLSNGMGRLELRQGRVGAVEGTLIFLTEQERFFDGEKFVDLWYNTSSNLFHDLEVLHWIK